MWWNRKVKINDCRGTKIVKINECGGTEKSEDRGMCRNDSFKIHECAETKLMQNCYFHVN